MPRLTCIHCAEPYMGNHASQKRCGDCRELVARVISRAQAIARRGAERGLRPNLKDPAVLVPCKDCGARATQWDHRDYGKPDQVDPVCKRCNLRRGPGLVPGAKGDLAYRYAPPVREYRACRSCRKAGVVPSGPTIFGYCGACRIALGKPALDLLRARMEVRTAKRWGRAA